MPDKLAALVCPAATAAMMIVRIEIRQARSFIDDGARGRLCLKTNDARRDNLGFPVSSSTSLRSFDQAGHAHMASFVIGAARSEREISSNRVSGRKCPVNVVQ